MGTIPPSTFFCCKYAKKGVSLEDNNIDGENI